MKVIPFKRPLHSSGEPKIAPEGPESQKQLERFRRRARLREEERRLNNKRILEEEGIW